MATLDLNLTGFAHRMREKALVRFRESVEAVADMARELAPVDTGELLEGIHTEYLENGTVGRVVSPAPHTIFAEFGTRLWAGKPFLRPALVATRPYWGGHYRAAIHMGAVVSIRHGGTYRPGIKPTLIAGTMPAKQANYKAIMARKLTAAKYNAALPDVALRYYGSTSDQRIKRIPKFNRTFKARRRGRRILWTAQ